MAGAAAAGWGPQVEPFASRAQVSLAGAELYVDLAELIDVGAEIARNEKERDKLASQIAGREKKLANAGFMERAPASVVEKERTSLLEQREKLAAVEAALDDLRRRNP
jgi:valyl-tRNA synthetase